MSEPEWSVEEASKALGLPVSTAYRYFRSLVDAGLLVNFSAGRYVIGPAIIEYDRQTRHFDPLIRSAAASLKKLVHAAPVPLVGLLCRIYRLTVICVDQAATDQQVFSISYERGRPMPLLKGAASLAIAAHLPTRTLKQYFEGQAGSAEDWDQFRARFRLIRREGVATTTGELDAGLVGISAPILGPEGDILASIGVVVRATDLSADILAALREQVRQAGIQVTSLLRIHKKVEQANK
jgi:DNA-binding IclR family transcriptional regulator